MTEIIETSIEIEMKDTKEYIVENGDTVQRVAIKFNTTPGDIARVNKLSPFQSVLFSGQKIIIPQPGDCLKPNVSLRPSNRPQPGSVTRISAPLPSTRHYSDTDNEDGLAERQFVKLKSYRIVGDGLQKCSGTLLITPKFLVFDPERVSVSSEGGADEVINCAEPLYNVALYLLLESVYSLNTYSSLAEIVNYSHANSTGVDKKPNSSNNGKDVKVDDEEQKSPNAGSTPPEDSGDFAPSVEASPASAAPEVLAGDQQPLLYLVVKAKPISDSYKGTDLPLNKVIGHSCHAQVFIFGVPGDRIEEAYSFLIISGIGGHCDRVVSRGSSSDQTAPSAPVVMESDTVRILVPPQNHNNLHKASPSRSTASNGSWLLDKDHYFNSMDSCDSSIEGTVSWEFVDSSQVSVVADALKEFEEERFVPQLKNGESNILNDEMVRDLCRNLPSHISDSNLHLVYKTGDHGYSLGTIYRKMSRFTCPTLLIVQDVSDTVFGAFMTDHFKISTHYYGNGETFVFHWSPDFKKYEWTRENSFFLKGDPSCFAIGSKSGHSAIWFEDTLKYGRSEPTDTFGNPRLSSAEDGASKTPPSQSPPASMSTSSVAEMEYNFVIKNLEVWRFAL